MAAALGRCSQSSSTMAHEGTLEFVGTSVLDGPTAEYELFHRFGRIRRMYRRKSADPERVGAMCISQIAAAAGAASNPAAALRYASAGIRPWCARPHHKGRSHVLTAMHIPGEVIDATFRVSLCRDTTKEDILALCHIIETELIPRAK